MPDQDQGFDSSRLTDILGLLGGAGTLAKAGAAATKGVLLTAPQFKQLRELNPNQAMHPAVAESSGWKGALTHPDAVKEQSSLDDYIYKNYDRMSRPYTPHDVNLLHNNYGWQVGPQTKFGREVSDVGASLKETYDPYKETSTLNLEHPAGNIQSVLGMSPGTYNNRLMMDISSPLAYNAEDKRVELDPIMRSLNRFGPYLRSKYDTPSYPYEKAFMPMVMHEVQHGVQDADYLPGVPHHLQPMEWESRGVEHSLLNPEAYKMPFRYRATQNNYDYDNFLRTLKLPKQLYQNGR